MCLRWVDTMTVDGDVPTYLPTYLRQSLWENRLESSSRDRPQQALVSTGEIVGFLARNFGFWGVKNSGGRQGRRVFHTYLGIFFYFSTHERRGPPCPLTLSKLFT